MTDDDSKDVTRLAREFFSILVRIHCRELYRDDLSAEMRRIDSELEELNAELLDSTKKIGEYLLKALS